MITVWGDSNNPELNTALADWAKARIPGVPRGFGPCVTMAVFDDGKPVAVVVYHNFDPDNGVIDLSVAGSQNWLNRSVLSEIADYVFSQLGCETAVMRAAEDNARVARILTAVGFDSVLVPRLRGREGGERIFTLTAKDWSTSKLNRNNRNG